MISPGDHDARALGIRIAEERPDALRIGVLIADLVEKHRQQADAYAVERMSRPLGDIERRLVLAERRAARVTNLDSPEGLLGVELKWACEELRRRAGAGLTPEETRELETLRSVTDAASPAPWKVGTGYEQSLPGTYVHDGARPSGIVAAEQDDTDCVLSACDARFMAMARNVLPWLLAKLLEQPGPEMTFSAVTTQEPAFLSPASPSFWKGRGWDAPAQPEPDPAATPEPSVGLSLSEPPESAPPDDGREVVRVQLTPADLKKPAKRFRGRRFDPIAGETTWVAIDYDADGKPGPERIYGSAEDMAAFEGPGSLVALAVEGEPKP
jgi:hypothetical protein